MHVYVIYTKEEAGAWQAAYADDRGGAYVAHGDTEQAAMTALINRSLPNGSFDQGFFKEIIKE